MEYRCWFIFVLNWQLGTNDTFSWFVPTLEKLHQKVCQHQFLAKGIFLISFFNLYDFLFKDVSKFCFVFLLKLRCEKSFSKRYSPSKYLIYCIISKSCICILGVSEIPSWLYAWKHMETCVIIEWSKWSS